MNRKTTLYNRYSHELEKHHLEDKFYLEMLANLVLFDKRIPSLKELINESHNQEIFTNSEYQKIYNNAKKRLDKVDDTGLDQVFKI